MAFRFRNRESVADGVRRILTEELSAAAASLENPQPNDGAAIHDARKNLKKSRAILRLVRDELGPVYDSLNKRLRNMGRKLSAIRDAQALLEVFEDLETRVGSNCFSGVREHLLRERDSAEARTGSLETTTAQMAKIAEAAQHLPLQSDGFAALRPGFVKTFRKGRQALEAIEEHPTDLAYHELRKRVKSHWYHVALLENTGGRWLQRYEKELKQLETRLGDDHNLSVLREKIRNAGKAGLDGEEVRAFLEVIGDRQKELRRKAEPEAAKLYGRKPADVARRAEREWERWKNGGR
jgi:CHAD domain-containing protein